MFQFLASSYGADSGISTWITVGIRVSGKPYVHTYKSVDSGVLLGANVVVTGGGEWQALTDGSSAPQGSYTLSFSSVSNAVTTPTGILYDGEGVLDATLPAIPSSPGTGSVNLHATF